MERQPSGFLVKQRAFLKLYLITLIENKHLYGLKLRDLLKEEFRELGYRPNHPEIYKALHDLIEQGILFQQKEKKQGTVYQEVVYYQFTEEGKEKAEAYKKQLKIELERCLQLLEKAIKDNFQ
ncbi:Replication termination protein [Sediminibacillus dalangtanensis]|uniref:Replication termination protein n=1 Tax=Sediminibacillus dalangtanensis TaxID=2729421 RepID=A0ABX7VRS4_9BACI|nr:helix-turn-helix transcriptional regulator [Sediminibacillus dalangtanensis]QTM99569.1 Replication termination protein [Sediminibacillus dalangtanensis]